jgi:hypothetical protein
VPSKLFSGLNPKQGQAILHNLPDLRGKEKASFGHCGVMCHNEPLLRAIIAKVVERVERRGEVMEEEGDPVRLARHGGGFDHARKLCGKLYQRQFFIAQQPKIFR